MSNLDRRWINSFQTRHQLTPITHLLASLCKWGGDLWGWSGVGGTQCPCVRKSSEREWEGMTWSEDEKRGLRGAAWMKLSFCSARFLAVRDERMMSHTSRRIAYTNTFPRLGLQKRKGEKCKQVTEIRRDQCLQTLSANKRARTHKLIAT